MRRILHLDMDAFFASVELRRHPELGGKPVIVGGRGDPTQRGVVASASYEARKFGIHSAMPLRTAYRHCPQAVFLPVDYPEYERVSAEIKAILRHLSSPVEDVGIDEAIIDISEIDRSSESIAKEIQSRIVAATGLTCSIGIAPNKLLAKMASDMQKPGGVTILTEADIPGRIWPLPVAKLPGVGPKTEARLNAIAVKTIEDLTRVSSDVLTEAFGPAHGAYLYDSARGIDRTPVITYWEPKSSGRQITFQKDVTDRETLVEKIAELARQLAEDLRTKGCKGKTVTLKVRFSDFKACTRQATSAIPTDSSDSVRNIALDCLNRIELNKPVRLIGLRVAGFLKVASAVQRADAQNRIAPRAVSRLAG